MARTLARSLRDSEWKALLRTDVDSHDRDLQALTADGRAIAGLAKSVASANRDILALKGLPASTGSLLRVRLAAPGMAAQLDAGASPWVAVASPDERSGMLTAYDERGEAHSLDPERVPDRPVYLLDLDVSRAHRVGFGLVDKELAMQGLRVPSAAEGGWWGTTVTAIGLKEDQEPWYKGEAEAFALVTGFGPDGTVRVYSVDMPYLAEAGAEYHPNQMVVNWSHYKYDLVDVVMMEDDDGTDYKGLAEALTEILLTVTDQGGYVPLVKALFEAMPDAWFTDGPDRLDSWYSLSKSAEVRLEGASGNGWMTVEPRFVEEL
ncbi:DUF3103 family protein [Streptomyces sp. NPDC015492]|uniref:DUF3103 family protein n=1 Tax=Streptomyces sp. NPDC015492 TaxID=3364958 RepID=UPI0036F8E9F7